MQDVKHFLRVTDHPQFSMESAQVLCEAAVLSSVSTASDLSSHFSLSQSDMTYLKHALKMQVDKCSLRVGCLTLSRFT